MKDIIPFNHFKRIDPLTIPFLEMYLEEIIASKVFYYKEYIVVWKFWALIGTRRMKWGIEETGRMVEVLRYDFRPAPLTPFNMISSSVSFLTFILIMLPFPRFFPAKLASAWFHEYANYIVSSGPLHLLFSLPGILFPKYPLDSLCDLLRIFVSNSFYHWGLP